MKNAVSFILLVILFSSCSQNKPEPEEKKNENYFHLSGNAQGTTFSIKYEDEKGRDLSGEVQEILDEMDRQLSTYIDSSVISVFNQSIEEIRNIPMGSDYFVDVFWKSFDILSKTDSAFNPLVFELVQYWGFGKKANHPEEIDSTVVDSLLKTISSHGIRYNGAENSFHCQSSTKFDFNGIAQGYTVDVIAGMLESKGVKNYMIEIGGEVRARGVNERGTVWNLGIEKPTDINEERSLQASVELKDRSMATSGNYRKFYEKDGARYSHTIDPKTGYPVQHSLLSATILAPDCASADAYATAFMVMGLEKSKEFLKNHPELKLDAYLIYAENGKFKTWASEGIKDIIQEEN